MSLTALNYQILSNPRLWLLLWGSLWLATSVSAQGTLSKEPQTHMQREPVVVPSPNVASLGMFGKVPVSHFTGVPNVGVPLYSFSEGPITVPISLSYHASGFRPDQHPGWVGAGWSLNAGGVITRSVNDINDDYNNSGQSFGQEAGYYFCYDILNHSDWNLTSGLTFLTNYSSFGSPNGPPVIPANIRDTEPDEFSFNFLGYSGRFYRTHLTGSADASWKVKCDKPVRVEMHPDGAFLAMPPNFSVPRYTNINGYSPTFRGFTLTVEDGTKYTFGGSYDDIEYSVGMFEQHRLEPIATSWHLTKITSPDGHQVVFHNEADSYIAQMYIAMNQTVSSITPPNDPTFSYCSSFNVTSNSSIEKFYAGKLIKPVYLASIEGTHSRVVFDRSATTELRYQQSLFDYFYNHAAEFGRQGLAFPYLEDDPWTDTYPTCLSKLQWRKLDQITVLRKSNEQPIKQVNLTYSDNTNNANAANERLALQSVTETGSDATLQPLVHQFAYNGYQYTDTGGTVYAQPPYVFNRTDHWGFFNDTDAPVNGVAANYYAYREPSASLDIQQSGLLHRIDYPTGGHTEFWYEQHRYGKEIALLRNQVLNAQAANPITGGVRIKRITTWDNANSVSNKEYRYVLNYDPKSNPNNTTASGILVTKAQYYFTNYSPSVISNGSSIGTGPVVNVQTVFSSNPVIPYSSSGGSHIGYSEVAEVLSDGSYTNYKYTNYDTALDELASMTLNSWRTIYDPFSSHEQKRGKLSNERVYNKHWQLVKDRTIHYTAPQLNLGGGAVRAVRAAAPIICDNGTFNPIIGREGTPYYFYTYSYLPSSESETTYNLDQQVGVTVSKTYEYDGNNQLTKQVMYDSQGNLHETSFTYTGSYNYIGPLNSGWLPISDVPKAMAIMQLKHMWSYPVETITSLNGQILSATVQTYRCPDANPTLVKPYVTYELELNAPLNSTQYTRINYSNPVSRSTTFDPDTKLKSRLGYDAYDNMGNVLEMHKSSNGEAEHFSYVWGYNKLLPLAKFRNARRAPMVAGSPHIGHEASYVGFESGNKVDRDPAEDYWQNINVAASGGDFDADAHTGQYAWRMNPPSPWSFNFGPTRVFQPHRTQRYTLSGWVKVDASVGAGAGRLVLSLNDNNGNYLGVLEQVTFGPTQGQWRYVETTIDLLAARQTTGYFGSVQVVAYCCYAGGAAPTGNIRVDDLRFAPAASEATTYTFDAATQQPSSTSGSDSRPIYYEYDGLQRLRLVRDHLRNIVKQHTYHYR